MTSKGARPLIYKEHLYKKKIKCFKRTLAKTWGKCKFSPVKRPLSLGDKELPFPGFPGDLPPLGEGQVSVRQVGGREGILFEKGRNEWSINGRSPPERTGARRSIWGGTGKFTEIRFMESFIAYSQGSQLWQNYFGDEIAKGLCLFGHWPSWPPLIFARSESPSPAISSPEIYFHVLFFNPICTQLPDYCF